jgi:protein-tyrosine phosphatase
VLSFFTKKEPVFKSLRVDIHSHLIPGVDDGSKTLDESIELLRRFKKMGYEKIITTPHIIKDFYPNTRETILDGLKVLQDRVQEENLEIELEVAAEHYIDEHLLRDINEDNILVFGGKYVLFETSFINEPANLNEIIFAIKSKGLIPVLAHPERYSYLQMKPELFDDLLERGTLFQLNIISLAGYYSRPAKKLAEMLIRKKQVHFAGSDCHTMRHLEALDRVRNSKMYQRLIELPLLNDTLI